MSDHSVRVVKVETILPHSGADLLEIIHVLGYQTVVRKGQYQSGDLVAYVQPDSMVDTTRPEFAFLRTETQVDPQVRITARRLRGEWSLGLLVPAPSGAHEGDDVAELLGVTHYEPPASTRGGDEATPPSGFKPVYDIESIRNFLTVLQPGEEVVASEKVHGANARFLYQDGVFHVGSRNRWLKEDGDTAWWRILRQHPRLKTYLQDYPGNAAYGEIYGSVQSLKYGHTNGKISLALFDIWTGKGWMGYDAFAATCDAYELPRVPVLYRGAFDYDTLTALAEGDTIIGNRAHIREGIVIRPVIERTDPALGRVVLKIVSLNYLAKGE